MGSKKSKLRVILLVAVLILSALLAFAADWIMYLCAEHADTEIVGYAVFTDGSEAYSMRGCVVDGNSIIVIGEDPQFVVAVNDEEETSLVHILFDGPLEQDTDLQVFYTYPGIYFTEENSARVRIDAGALDCLIEIPGDYYAYLRFDFEQDVVLKGIYSEKENPLHTGYSPNIRVVFFALEAFCLLWMIIRSVSELRKKDVKEALQPRRKRRREQHGFLTAIRNKPILIILLCNLFLSLTVVFFQPCISVLETISDPMLLSNWWIQLLIACGITLVLTGLMLLLPERAGRIAAAVSLCIGIAFLAQCLLLNEGKPLEMNTNWPMMMLNIFVWIGIVLVVLVLFVDAINSQEKRAEIAMRIAAWILILFQAVNLTVLWTAEDDSVVQHLAHPPVLEEQEIQEIPSEGMGLGELMNISMRRGLPYLAKDLAGEAEDWLTPFLITSEDPE